MRIISSAYATLQRNQRNLGWSERLSIRQRHVGDGPPRVFDGRRFAWDIMFQATPYKEHEPDETRRPEPASNSEICCLANGNRLLGP